MHETSLDFSIWKNLEIWNNMPKCPENMLNPQLVAHLLAFWWRTCPILREHWLITMSTSQFLIIFSPPSLDKKSICTLNNWPTFCMKSRIPTKTPLQFSELRIHKFGQTISQTWLQARPFWGLGPTKKKLPLLYTPGSGVCDFRFKPWFMAKHQQILPPHLPRWQVPEESSVRNQKARNRIWSIWAKSRWMRLKIRHKMYQDVGKIHCSLKNSTFFFRDPDQKCTLLSCW